MPTKPTLVLTILAMGLYIIANQTQVGWVYIIVNGLVGLLLVAFFFSFGMLKPIQGQRALRNLSKNASDSASAPQNRQQNQPNGNAPGDDDLLTLPDFYEDDPIEVTLQFVHRALKPAFLVGGQEICPFAPADEQVQSFFTPSLFKGQVVNVSYQTDCYRRGLYTFPPLPLRSKGPFNLFSTRRNLSVPGEVLIFPKYHPFRRMRLLENRGFADRKVRRVGTSSEVIGTREYRSGDALRQIHWRSTARVGKLVVKEFSDDDQLTMTVVLDLSVQGNTGQGKFSTFETALRLAASFGYYATQQAIPFHLVGHSQRWRPPAMALSWSGILNYLAKVQNDGPEPLANVVRNLSPLPFVIVLISNPNGSINQELALLQTKGVQVLAIFITPDGDTPPVALAHSSGLEIRTVNPHNWPAMLDKL
jgi:uncharacterized protein (DUF58 family)